MTTSMLNFDLVCEELKQRTGCTWRIAGDKDMYCWDSTQVLISEDGRVRIIFDPPGETFSVGVEWDDIYLASGHDLESMIDADPRLEKVLSGELLPGLYFNEGREDWRAETPKPAKPHERTLFQVNVFGLFTLVVKV